MADGGGKLWFEMGVKDEVTKQLEIAMSAASKLGENLDSIVQGADKLTKALYKTSEIKDKLMSSIGTGKGFGLDTTNIEKGLTKLEEFEKKLKSISNEDFTSNKGNAKGMIGADYQQMLKSITEVIRQQEKLNTLASKNNNNNTHVSKVGWASDIDKSSISEIEKAITSSEKEAKTLGSEINRALGELSKNPSNGQLDYVHQLTAQYDKLKNHIDSLYSTLNKFNEVKGTLISMPYMQNIKGISTAPSQEEHALRQREIEEAFKTNDIKVKSEKESANRISDIKEQEAISDQEWERKKEEISSQMITKRLQNQMEASAKLSDLKEKEALSDQEWEQKKKLEIRLMQQINLQ